MTNNRQQQTVKNQIRNEDEEERESDNFRLQSHQNHNVLQEIDMPLQPLRRYKEPRQTSPSENSNTIIPPLRITPVKETHQRLTSINSNESNSDEYISQDTKQRLWKEYSANYIKVQSKTKPEEYYTLKWKELRYYLNEKLSPVYIESIVIQNHITWIKLYKKYGELIRFIEHRMIQVLYNLYC